jgi:DNA-binding response OmpR family regulator
VIGELELDLAAREAWIRGQRPSFTTIELGILELLLRRYPGVADRRSLIAGSYRCVGGCCPSWASG